MHLDNGTPYTAGFTVATDVDGREHAVVVVKGSFRFPDGTARDCPLADDQEPLLMADTFWGNPGMSAPRSEMDFAHVKSRCDVLLEAAACAPGGRPVEQVRVGLRVGNWGKALDVFGDRVWLSSVGPPRVSSARPFVEMPITYGRAFGGVDRSDPADDPPHAYLDNPVGRGWHRVENAARLNGLPLPNVEFANDRVSVPWGRYRPAGLGPLGRGWPARLRHAGTYDQNWLDNVFPFLPRDFDLRYYQAAPDDQQIPSPRPGTEVVLSNLTPEGTTAFRLPGEELPFHFARERDEDVAAVGHMDTLVLRPSERRLTLTWRASLPLQRDIFEVTECIIGRRPAGFWRARELGKTYYPSLRELVRSGKIPEPAE